MKYMFTLHKEILTKFVQDNFLHDQPLGFHYILKNFALIKTLRMCFMLYHV